MKHSKYIIILASAMGALLSCTERDFTPVTGNTPVEFVYSEQEVNLSGAYHYIPIQMTEQASTSSLATVELTGGSITLKDGSVQSIEEGTNIIITSKEIYIGAFDPEADIDPITGTNVDTLGNPVLPSNNIEVRIPSYNEYQNVTLEFKLVGDNLGARTTTKYIAEAPTELVIEGTYKIDGETFYVTADPSDESKYWISYFSANAQEYSAVRENNTLTVSNTDFVTVNAGEDYGEVDCIMCAFDGEYLYPDEKVVLDFAEGSVTATNGIFLGFTTGGSSWAGYVMILNGTTGTKQ